MAVAHRPAVAFSSPPSRIISPLMDMKGFSSSSKDSRQYEHFTFIQEDPTLPNQRKKPRTLTACDRCRARKVKCEQQQQQQQEAVSSDKCDACLLARQDCTYKARDGRYHYTSAQPPPTSIATQGVSTHSTARQAHKDLGNPTRNSPSPPAKGTQSHLGKFLHSLKRPSPGDGRTPVETAGIEAASSGAPMTSRNPRPLSHVSTSPGSRPMQGLMSPTIMSPGGPPLSPVNVQASMLFDYPAHPTFPRREHMPALILGFFEHFAAYMPFLQQGDITARANAGRLWNIHALAIAALASRFSTLPVHSSDPRGDHSNIYLSMAKPLITQYKGQMTLQALQGLIMLSWAECGNIQEQSTSVPMLSALPGSPQFYISEAVKAARALKLGFTAAINNFGAPREEVQATWWSLMLIDELVAWNNSRPAMLEGRDFDHVFPVTTNAALDTFYQVSALSLQRRKVGRALFAPNASPGGINASIEGMNSIYADIRTNRTLLDFGQANLQNALRHGQVNTYMSLHVLYYSTLVRVRVRGMTTVRYPLGSDKDPALMGARRIVDMIRWCNAENRSQAIIDNIFIETPLFEAGQALSLASEAMANAGLGSEFYLNEINEVHSTLRTLSGFWATASYKVASFSGAAQSYNYPSSSLSPIFSTINMGSSHAQPMPFEYPSHGNMPGPMGSPSLYGWNHPAGSSPFHSPHLLASSPTGETYDHETYLAGGSRRSRPSSPQYGHLQHNVYDQRWR